MLVHPPQSGVTVLEGARVVHAVAAHDVAATVDRIHTRQRAVDTDRSVNPNGDVRVTGHEVVAPFDRVGKVGGPDDVPRARHRQRLRVERRDRNQRDQTLDLRINGKHRSLPSSAPGAGREQ
jgi:hypothetical protein